VASKRKDPYYLVTANPGFLTTPLMGLTPVGLKDFTPIANLVFDPYVVVTGANTKYKSMKDLIADAKANPKKVTVGGGDIGNTDSICTDMIERAAGVKFNYVGFAGGGDVTVAVIGGHVDFGINNPGEALELYKAGKVRLLGVFSEKRLAAAPEIPTLQEQGIDALFVQNRGLYAPADIPADARKTLEEALFKYTKTDTFKKYVNENMLIESWMDSATFGKYFEKLNEQLAVTLNGMGLLKKK
jgi:putative tricarboxylic transport membrane protein